MNFQFFKKRKDAFIQPTTKIYRTKTIEGVSIPAFIHNGIYHFVDLDVYEDGRIDCWNFEDFEHFKQDVKRGWVELNIPENGNISIYGLGNWVITKSAWTFNKESFIEYAQSLVKQLNPEMENIFKYRQKIVSGVRVGESGKGTIYKSQDDGIFAKKINGNSINLFYKSENDYYLTRVTVFADLTINLGRLEKPLDLTFEQLQELVHEKIVVTALPKDARVHIYGLGNFSVSENSYCADIDQKLLEIKDLLGEFKGEPSAIEACIQAYEKYIETPNAENKEHLKISYENVPEHNRMYVGDMDTKDIPVRMILYGEQEIENWSHYVAAKHEGIELPSIKIPKQ